MFFEWMVVPVTLWAGLPTMKVKPKELLYRYYKTIMGFYAEIGDELPAEE